MSRRDLSQPSFVDAMVSGYGRVGGFLDRLGKAFDWAAFEALLSPIHGSAMGAPGYPPLTMFKIVLLQQWHTLSDPAAEEAVRATGCHSGRFCGLPLEVETPDHASIWRFRQTIDKLGLSTKLLAEVNRQLDALGLVIKRGTLVDATIIAGSVAGDLRGRRRQSARPRGAFHAQARQDLFRLQGASGGGRGERPCAPGRDDPGQCTRQPKSGRSLIQGDEQGFFADRAYDSQVLRETLERRGLVDGIAWKVKHARYPLEPWQKLHNAWAGRVRSSRRSALSLPNEALVWNGPCPLSGAFPQRLSSAVRRDRDEHEAGARAHARSLTHSQERRLPDPGKPGPPAKNGGKPSPTTPTNPLSQPHPIAPGSLPLFCKALCQRSLQKRADLIL